MTQTYFPFDSGAGANITESQWGEMAQLWLNTGVVKGQLNQLNTYADSTGLQVKVDTGKAWIQGYYFKNDALVILPISTADTSNPRIDRVVVRVDWTTNTIQLAVLQGVPATSPTPPALTQNTSRWEISLAQVYVGANVSTIAAGNITDERFPSGQFSPSYLNGWVDNSISYPSFYMKDSDNTVFYYIYIKSGSTALNVVPFTFPAGYRPYSSMTLRGYADGVGDIIYHITNGGEVKWLRSFGASTFVLLVGSFKAGN